VVGSDCCCGLGPFNLVFHCEALEKQQGREKEELWLLAVPLTAFTFFAGGLFYHAVGAHWAFHDGSRAIQQCVKQDHGYNNDNNGEANRCVNFGQECELGHVIKADCKDGHAQHELEHVCSKHGE
jgi:hypothetical protein